MADTENKINLRDLDDVDCANIVVARQIKKFIRKFQSFKTTSIDCWISRGHFITFKYSGDKFIWESAPDKYGCKTFITSLSENLSRFDLNKLLVFTFNTMCDMNNSEDISDTAEDLLAYAESKLREMLTDEAV